MTGLTLTRVAGIVGAILTGVFATTAVNPGGADGLLAGDAAQLGVQIVAVVVTMIFAGGMTAGVLGLLHALVGLRVPLHDEVGGVDLSEHGEEAYSCGDIGTLLGRRAGLGESVLIPAAQIETPAAEAEPALGS